MLPESSNSVLSLYLLFCVRITGSSIKKSVDLLSIQAVLPLQMTTKMKGLLKGLRCISQIFGMLFYFFIIIFVFSL